MRAELALWMLVNKPYKELDHREVAGLACEMQGRRPIFHLSVNVRSKRHKSLYYLEARLLLATALSLLICNQVKRGHTVTIFGVQVSTMLHEDHQHGLSAIEGCEMKRCLVLIVFLIDVVAKQEKLLEAVHAVGNDRVEYVDCCALVLLCIDWFHDLENLLVSLLGLVRLKTAITAEQVLDVRKAELNREVHRVSTLSVLEAELSLRLASEVKQELDGIIVVDLNREVEGCCVLVACRLRPHVDIYAFEKP